MLLLKKERERQGISAAKLAAKIGVDRSSITHLDRDDRRPTLWILIKMAHGLGHSFTSFVREAEKSSVAKQ
ncbi:MAG TPA: helix-turn-helix transcriptional regulator [Prosthecobacter sp.]|nr:helix-turn-helix transcriptional regulator [Prosthecobacter sp.]